MTDYIGAAVEEFPDDLKGLCVAQLWNEDLFKVSTSARALIQEKADQFHTFMTKMLFASKRAWPDM